MEEENKKTPDAKKVSGVKLSRKVRREKYAEEMCREVRYQLGNQGGIYDNQKLFKILIKWMNVAKKNKWLRP